MSRSLTVNNTRNISWGVETVTTVDTAAVPDAGNCGGGSCPDGTPCGTLVLTESDGCPCASFSVTESNGTVHTYIPASEPNTVSGGTMCALSFVHGVWGNPDEFLRMNCTTVLDAAAAAGCGGDGLRCTEAEGDDSCVPGTPATTSTSTSTAGSIEFRPVILNYARNSVPFGSINPPYPPLNPYEWDTGKNTDINTNIEPLYVFKPNTDMSQANAGTPFYGIDGSCTYSPRADEMVNGEEMIRSDPVEVSENTALCNQFICGPDNENNAYIHCPGGWEFVSCMDSSEGSNHGCSTIPNGCHAWEGDDNNGGKQCTLTCRHYGQITPATPDVSTTYTRNISLDYNVSDTPTQAEDGLKRLFAQTYGAWQWNGTHDNGFYEKLDCYGWSIPPLCANNPRPAYPNDNCSIKPEVRNIYVNNSSTTVSIVNSQFANLTFNSVVDSQQIPLTMYTVDWGDGEKTSVSGVEMVDRPNIEHPHSLYHLYSYWDIRSRMTAYNDALLDVGIDCTASPMPAECIDCTGNACKVRPRVIIRDNWGWCSGDSTRGQCNNYSDFMGTIEVREK